MDITNVNLCEIIPDLECPRCKHKKMKRTGTKFRENLYLLTCYNCYLEEWVNPKNVEFTYEPLKEVKKKKSEVEN